ncbi:MAG: hypothetical protein WDM84_00545 [Bauldia sp.]
MTEGSLASFASISFSGRSSAMKPETVTRAICGSGKSAPPLVPAIAAMAMPMTTITARNPTTRQKVSLRRRRRRSTIWSAVMDMGCGLGS